VGPAEQNTASSLEPLALELAAEASAGATAGCTGWISVELVLSRQGFGSDFTKNTTTNSFSVIP
jgi:hypothetical protein